MKRRKFESDSGISFPVIRKEYWERALNQSQQDHEKKKRIQQDVHGENQNTFEYVRSRYLQSLTSPRKRNVSPMKLHIVRFVHGVRSASRPRALTENTPNKWRNPEHIPVVEFDYAFATDTPGGPKVSMMVTTDSIHGSIFAGVARRKGGQDDYLMQSSKITSIGWVW